MAAKSRRWLTAWVPHRLEMLISPAWQLAPRPLRRLLERLEIEHLRHGGFNNGELFVSFSQFVDAGISRRAVKPTIDLGVGLGLIEVFQDADGHQRDIRPPNAYRLTYVPAKGKTAPTDEWKTLKSETVKLLVAAFKDEGAPISEAERKVA